MSYVLGIDVGSLSTEVVIMDREKNYEYVIVSTGANSRTAAERALQLLLSKTDRKKEEIYFTVATGYGRINLPFADKRVTEITCHGLGAHFLFPTVATVIDIGGQDSKVIRLDPNGKVVDFVMNEKCAAGTGRFLEVMARSLEVELDQMGELGLQAKKTVPISSLCTVFAESEVVSLVAAGHPVKEIIRGIHDSIAERTSSLVKRVGLAKDVVMTGGVAKNIGVVRSLEERLGVSLHIPDEPQIVGALGAALIAWEEKGW
ncbi:MAG: 2-hydroxyglutaryl-CoA dehydratase [Firmicutes bacterium]|nr:2-hydroxyglutaryl-CoA dehydratase [Bacillota bacterium]